MDSKFIKSHQCSQERSHVVLIEINPEFGSRPSPYYWTHKADDFKHPSQEYFRQIYHCTGPF